MSMHNVALSLLRRLTTAASVAAIITTWLPIFAAAQPRQLPNQQSFPGDTRSVTTTLKIVSPKNGAVLHGESVKLSIQVGSGMVVEKLKIRLNGKQLNSHRNTPSCAGNFCTVTMTLSDPDGLREGNNRLRADIVGKEGRRSDTRTTDFQFDENGQLGSAANQPTNYIPASLGFSTTENGGNGKPWVTITTGQTAGVNDPVQSYPALTDKAGTTTYSPALPAPDVSFTTDCSGTTYQAIVLDRTNPTTIEAKSCINSLAEMESDFQSQMERPLNANDLIIFGTTPYNFAQSNLDTSDIGGTNWTRATKSDPSQYPAYYVIAGVKGASPGTAHENFLPSPHQDIPYTWAAFLRGSMVKDSSGYYNYIPGGEQTFQAISGSNPTITIGSTTYTPRQAA